MTIFANPLIEVKNEAFCDFHERKRIRLSEAF